MLIETQFAKCFDNSSPDPAEIRRHRNGSINLDHYVRIGRTTHGAAVRGGVRRLAEIFRRRVRCAGGPKRA